MVTNTHTHSPHEMMRYVKGRQKSAKKLPVTKTGISWASKYIELDLT